MIDFIDVDGPAGHMDAICVMMGCCYGVGDI